MRKVRMVLFTVVLVVSLASAAGAATNLMTNPGAEKMELSPYSGYPQELLTPRARMAEAIPAQSWGCYPSCGFCTWGVTDKEAHGGKYSAFLAVDGSDSRGVTELNLCLGQTDGRSGKYAFVAKAKTTYYFSFWLKGNPAPSAVYVRWLGWKTEDGSMDADKREWRDTNLIGKGGIVPGTEWKKYEGTFMTTADTKKFAMRIQIPVQAAAQKGQTIYVDDVEISEFSADNIK